MNIKKIRVNDLEIEYIIKGEGKAMLFLHGGSVSFRSSKVFLDEVSKYFKVYAISLPGAGKSSKIPKKWKYEDFINLIKSYSDKFNLQNGIICGHSLGGAFATCVCASYPDYFKKAILLAPVGAKQEHSAKSIYTVVKNHIRSLFKDSTLRDDILINLRYHFSDMSKLAKIFSVLDLVDTMKRLQNEVILMWGKQDEVISFDDSKIFQKNIKKCRLYTFNGTHGFLNEYPRKVVDIIKMS
ncbi:alpha/beta hydrolase [Candidatus Dojkabacteria bacterium]|nr:alpha/beta hydrolase [Candidatus Dojkabacteria bacterium]